MEKIIDVKRISEGEKEELARLGMLASNGTIQPYAPPLHHNGYRPIKKKAISAPDVLNEAYIYHPTPSSFSRGMHVELRDFTILFISGTASVDEEGKTVHVGDFRAQCWRTYRNITRLLHSEGATWHDVVRCTCYLRDIERDYKEFNQIRTAFFHWLGLNPLPASTGVQARLCRDELLVEIEATAILEREP